MVDICGKTLLILAASHNMVEIVERSRELGVRTVVTDWYPPEKSPAKLVADEYWDVSWNDIDELERRCRAEGVDGVMAGFSEFAVGAMVELCDRLGLPCYCTKRQLEVTSDKALFKEACRAHGVPVVRDYPSPRAVERFPVIVKPVDRAGSIGVGIARNPEELDVAYGYAMECSVCKRVVIEDFVEGTKVDAYYALSDGEIVLLGTSDTIDAAGNDRMRVVQSGWVLPSRSHGLYLEAVDQSVRAMASALGMRDGFLFVSGFRTGEAIVVFECGFRLSGGHVWRYFSVDGTPDVRELLIRHALSGSCGVSDFSSPRSGIHGLIMNFYARKGTLYRMCGLEEISSLEGCGFVLQTCAVGTECCDDKAILKKLAMVHLYGRDKRRLIDKAQEVNRLFTAVDENGRDMVYDRMSRNTLECAILERDRCAETRDNSEF